MVFSEIVFMSGTFIIGFLFSSLILKNETPYFISIISFFSGISLFFFGLFPILIMTGKVNALSLASFYIILSIILLLCLFFFSKNFLKQLLFLLISTCLFTGICIILLNFDFNLFCGDTFLLSNCAKSFLEMPESFTENIKILASWGAVFVLIQHISYELGAPYFLVLQPVLYLSFTLCFQMLVYMSLIKMNISPYNSLISSIFSAALLATSPIFLNVVLLLHTNSFLIYYLFLFLSFYWIGEITKDKKWFYLSYIFLLTASFSRVEGPIYGTIILFCLLYKDTLEKDRTFPIKAQQITQNGGSNKQNFQKNSVSSESRFLNFSICYFFLMGMWFTFLFFIGVDSDILSKGRPVFLAVLYLIIPVLIKMLNMPYFKFFKINLFNLIYIGVLVFFILVFIINPHDFLSSLKGIKGNLSTKVWRGILIFIFSSLIFMLFRKREKIILEKSILVSIFFIILSILAFSFFRIPFYKSLYDSSNRLFVMLIPIAIFYLTLKFHAQQFPRSFNLSLKHLEKYQILFEFKK